MISLIPLNKEFHSANSEITVAGKTFCLLEQTHFPVLSSCANKHLDCMKGDSFNLESPKSPCVEAERM